MTVKFLRANNGDSILISFHDDEGILRNILIDGGTGNTYSYKNYKNKDEPGDLKNAIEEIKGRESNSKIDLLILTHVDDDHIGGLLKWMENDPGFADHVQRIWFNSGKLIFEKFKVPELEENQIKLKIKKGNNTSIKQGVTFENYAAINGLWDRRLIMSGQSIDFYNAQFEIISPAEDNLKALLTKWRLEQSSSLTSKSNDYKKSLSLHILEDKFEEDDAVHNGSSIAFVFKFKGKSYLFLADGHPKTMIEGLEKFGYSATNKLKAELVKISHHGSKGNTSRELFSLIDTDNFIISSNGQIHNLPDKQCLSRIINTYNAPTIFFNYPELIESIFSEEDRSEHDFFAKPISEFPLNDTE